MTDVDVSCPSPNLLMLEHKGTIALLTIYHKHFRAESCLNFSTLPHRSAAPTMTKSGETWVVTGASRGIGFEYVKQARYCHPVAA